MLKNSAIVKTFIFLLLGGYPFHICIAQVFPVEGTLFGRPFQTNVDHELAKTMLTNPADSNVIQLFLDYYAHELNTETLSEITQKFSFDVATIFFIEKLYEQEENRRLQDFYLAMIDTLSLEDETPALSFLQDYFIAFVPGFRYEHIDNGGDFLRQRILFDSAGINYEMIKIEGVGRVGRNAEIIANRLKELSELHNKIIVISVSKGGLETAIALGELVDFQSISSVKAWINVGGILKGTPVADRWAKPFMRFWISCGLFWANIKVDLKGLLTDMSYKQGKDRYNALNIPPEIYTVNLIAASLGQEQKKKTVFTSPNDSFSPLADAITEKGVVVVEVGNDHYFRDVDLNTRMVALLRYTVTQIK
jgi:hypothetical protein